MDISSSCLSISLFINEVSHIFLCLLSICISSSVSMFCSFYYGYHRSVYVSLKLLHFVPLIYVYIYICYICVYIYTTHEYMYIYAYIHTYINILKCNIYPFNINLMQNIYQTSLGIEHYKYKGKENRQPAVLLRNFREVLKY